MDRFMVPMHGIKFVEPFQDRCISHLLNLLPTRNSIALAGQALFRMLRVALAIHFPCEFIHPGPSPSRYVSVTCSLLGRLNK